MSINTEKKDNFKIKVEKLFKSFDGKEVLKGIDMNVKERESFVIIGGSGNGKSVLIKNIIGLLEPTSGDIFVDSTNVTKLSSRERSKLMCKFGMLFQGGALFDSLRIWENVSFELMHNNKMKNKDAKEFAIEKLKDVGMSPDVADFYPSELSGGMQKRASLARTIANNPEVIFFDEPTTGLDPIMSDIINELIIKCSESLGATIISITHDLNSARKIADRIAMIYEGKFIWEGKKEDLDNSGNPYLEQFIKGSSEGPINLM